MTNKYKAGQTIILKSDTSQRYKILEALENTALVDFGNSMYWNKFSDLDCTFTIEKEDWRPKDGDKYYYASSDGCVYDDTFYSTNITDGYRLATKNCFKTEAEAEQRLSEIKKEYGIK